MILGVMDLRKWTTSKLMVFASCSCCLHILFKLLPFRHKTYNGSAESSLLGSGRVNEASWSEFYCNENLWVPRDERNTMEFCPHHLCTHASTFAISRIYKDNPTTENLQHISTKDRALIRENPIEEQDLKERGGKREGCALEKRCSVQSSKTPQIFHDFS